MKRFIYAHSTQGNDVAAVSVNPPYVNDAATLSKAFAQLAKTLEEVGNPQVVLSIKDEV